LVEKLIILIMMLTMDWIMIQLLVYATDLQS